MSCIVILNKCVINGGLYYMCVIYLANISTQKVQHKCFVLIINADKCVAYYNKT